MPEYISREETLKAFKLTAKNSNKDYQRGLQDAIDCLVPEVIAGIPSADVQPIDKDNSLIAEPSEEEKVKMKWARKVLHTLEHIGAMEHFLKDEHIKAIRIAEYALDEMTNMNKIKNRGGINEDN